jgi:DNA-binding transcriptional ArsR family regulator
VGGPTTVFQAIGDPTRRRIMELVRDRERSVGELAFELQMEQAAVARHLRVLRGAGVVSDRHDGHRRSYALRTAPLAELDDWLGRLRTD